MQFPFKTMPNRYAVLVLGFALPFASAFAGLSTAGLPNFHPVDDHVYRGAQPTSEGFRNLAQMGVKTVIDLRGSEHSMADEKRIVESAGMKYISIPMRGMATPADEQVLSALKIMNDPSAGPVFVHCKRGADRTGAVIACYRIGHDRWDSGKALHEASGFGMSWYQIALRHYVDGYDGKSFPMSIPATIVP
jgi:protein tyrosine/serine phosphatase